MLLVKGIRNTFLLTDLLRIRDVIHLGRYFLVVLGKMNLLTIVACLSPNNCDMNCYSPGKYPANNFLYMLQSESRKPTKFTESSLLKAVFQRRFFQRIYISILNIKSNHKFLEVHEERKINLKLGLCKIWRKNHKDRRNLEFQFKIPLYQPLERALCFNFLKINIEDISLYWFAAQQQTSTFRT